MQLKKRFWWAAAGAVMLGAGWLGCSVELASVTPQGIDAAANVTSEAAADALHADANDSGAPRHDSGAITCGSNQCTGFVNINYTVRPCCPSYAPDHCGYILPMTGVCIERDQPGAPDPSCPRFVIPQRNREGDADIDANLDWYTVIGCCKPTGICGYWDNIGDASFSGNSLGCVSHKDWSVPDQPVACGAVTADAGVDAAPDAASTDASSSDSAPE